MPPRTFKRFEMEIGLSHLAEVPLLPAGYLLIPWNWKLLENHAEVKYLSFRNELDAGLFSCFNSLDTCRALMNYIASKPQFLPEATWLAAFRSREKKHVIYCATIQGVIDDQGNGAIMNIGVVPEHRGKGLGRIITTRALWGFREAGCRKAHLEVSAENELAVNLYSRIGFHKTRILYRLSNVLNE